MANGSRLAVMSAAEMAPVGHKGTVVVHKKRGPKPTEHPTAREIEVLQWVYQGLNNNEIAEVMEISPLTVKRHLFLLSKFLRIKSRTRLVTFALEQGWLKLPAK